MRDGWKDTTLSEVLIISRERVDPSQLEPDYELIHWSIPKLDETGGPSTETASEIGSHKFSVLKDSVVYSLLNPRIPRFAKIAGGNRVVCSTEFAVLQPDSNLSLDFLYCFVTSPNFQEQVRSLAKGTTKSRERIDNKEIYKLRLKLPPLPEQKRIVDLISSVDSYIEALQQQLESGKKSRIAVLHELLTADGEDWVETTLDGIAEYINGYPFKPSDLGEGGLPVIRIKQLLDPNEPVDRTETDTPDRCLLTDGDIVFSWSGTLAVRIWNRGPAKLNQHLFRVVEKKGVYKGIIPLILDHAIEELEEKSHGTTMKHITKQTLLLHKVLLPPLPEQKRIVEIVNSIDEVIANTEHTISKAKVLRSGLLSDLLTGAHAIPAIYDKVMSTS
jgi:restriction endonuclease S subunit